MEKHFKVADIRYSNGTLTVDTTSSFLMHKHYNVTVTTEGDTMIVTGEQVKTSVAFSKGQFDVTKITKDSIELYKPWPWSKTLKKRSLEIVEYIKRDFVSYYSTNHILIENT